MNVIKWTLPIQPSYFKFNFAQVFLKAINTQLFLSLIKQHSMKVYEHRRPGSSNLNYKLEVFTAVQKAI
jgi:hypothetical protein